MFKELIKIANELDERGLTDEADTLDEIIGGAEEGGDASSIVIDAIERSAGMPHFEKTFETRNPGPDSEGSVFNEPQSVESLKAAKWEAFSHPDIKAPAKGFSAQIPGKIGLVNLADLDPSTPIRMELGHKGEDEFVTTLIDKADAPLEKLEVDFTVMLIGPGEGGDIVWTFFPGDPIMPSSMTPSTETESASTAQDAIDLGFSYGKVTGQ